MVKPRTVSFDDGFFPEFEGRVLVVGVVMRGSEVVENVVSGKITVDGDDATGVVAKLVASLPQQVNAIFLDGITFGGFNVLDLEEIHNKTGIPVISVTRSKPDMDDIKNALEHVPDGKAKWEKICANGPINSHGRLFFQCRGVTPLKAKQLVTSCSKSGAPEGLRLAHIIASGLTRSGALG